MRQGNSHFDDPASAGDRAGPLGEGSPSTANRAFSLLTGAFSWFFLGMSFAILTQTLLGRIVAGSYAMEWKVQNQKLLFNSCLTHIGLPSHR